MLSVIFDTLFSFLFFFVILFALMCILNVSHYVVDVGEENEK